MVEEAAILTLGSLAILRRDHLDCLNIYLRHMNRMMKIYVVDAIPGSEFVYVTVNTRRGGLIDSFRGLYMHPDEPIFFKLEPRVENRPVV